MISPFWEGFLLFLIEIGFMAIIGFMYVAFVFLAMWTVNAVSRLINIIREKLNR